MVFFPDRCIPAHCLAGSVSAASTKACKFRRDGYSRVHWDQQLIKLYKSNHGLRSSFSLLNTYCSLAGFWVFECFKNGRRMLRQLFHLPSARPWVHATCEHVPDEVLSSIFAWFRQAGLAKKTPWSNSLIRYRRFIVYCGAHGTRDYEKITGNVAG